MDPQHAAGNRPRVLLITYLFPPAGGIPVQRMLSLARYLPSRGFDVFVLSARNPSVPTLDQRLVDSVPPEVQVTRTWSPEIPYAWRQAMWRRLSRSSGGGAKAQPATPKTATAASGSSWIKDMARRIFSPDPEVVWNRGALRAAKRIVREQSIDVVVVSVPPFSSLQIGIALKRQFPRLRLISDFRDEWLDFYLNAFDYFRNANIRKQAEGIEKNAVRASDLVLSITGSCVRRIRARYPDLEDSRFVCWPNGFDPAAFAEFRPRAHDGSRLRVAHIGTVYPTSTPRYYFDAIDSLPDATRDRIETHFVGRITDQERPYFANRKAHVVEHGFVSQQEAIRFMEEADVLLLVMTDPNFASGKIYEYLATGKPILAISPAGGEVEDVIRTTGAGWVISPEEPEALRAALMNILDRYSKGELAGQSRRDRVEAYARPQLAEQFAGYVKRLLGN